MCLAMVYASQIDRERERTQAKEWYGKRKGERGRERKSEGVLMKSLLFINGK